MNILLLILLPIELMSPVYLFNCIGSFFFLYLNFDGETATDIGGELDERRKEERQNPGNTKVCNFMA